MLGLLGSFGNRLDLRYFINLYFCGDVKGDFCKTLASDVRQRSYVLRRVKRSGASPFLRNAGETLGRFFETISKCLVCWAVLETV